jgi:adenylate cyclase
MLRVRLDPSGLEFAIQPGERVLDAADASGRAVLPTACRAGNCGICLVRVEDGSDTLVPPEPAEVRLLAELRAPAGQRLGCQIAIRLDADVEAGPLVLVGARDPRVPPRSAS